MDNRIRKVIRIEIVAMIAVILLAPVVVANIPNFDISIFTEDGKTHIVGIAEEDIAISESYGVVDESPISAGDMTCQYCRNAKEILRRMGQDIYDDCMSQSGRCCKAPCPADAVIKADVPFIGQCTDAMGEGGDCWYDGVPPDMKTKSGSPPSKPDKYCDWACGIASTRMALQAFNLDRSSKELFCGGPESVFDPNRASVIDWITREAGEMGLSESRTVYKAKFSWDEIVENIQSGKVIVFLLSDFLGIERPEKPDKPARATYQSDSAFSSAEAAYALELEDYNAKKRAAKDEALQFNERCFLTGGHYILLYGAGEDYVIANDPYGWCYPGWAETIVISRKEIERTARAYSVIG